MVFRLSRQTRAGPFLEWKVAIFSAGAVLGMAGIFLDLAWLRIAGIVVLASGMLVRFFPGAREASQEDDDEDGDDQDAVSSAGSSTTG